MTKRHIEEPSIHSWQPSVLEQALPSHNSRVTSKNLRQGVFVLGVAAVFGVLGMIAAASSAHLVLTTPHGPQTTAGPAWLFSGLGGGAVFGAVLAMGLTHFAHRRSH
jgi:hypothetical protein